MGIQHESDFDDFSVMIDPIKGKVSLLCPAPVIGFNNVDDFVEFVNMLQEWIPALRGHMEGHKEPEIDSSYAKKVLGQWEIELKNSLPPSPKSPRPGRKKSNNEPKTSSDKENL